jgi:hypothetical protein
MIMADDQGRRIVPKCLFDDDPRMHRGTIERATKELLAGNHLMTLREIDRREHLVPRSSFSTGRYKIAGPHGLRSSKPGVQ